MTLAKLLLDFEIHITVHCEICGVLGGVANNDYFSDDGHLAMFADSPTTTMQEANKIKKAHQKYHDSNGDLQVDANQIY